MRRRKLLGLGTLAATTALASSLGIISGCSTVGNNGGTSAPTASGTQPAIQKPAPTSESRASPAAKAPEKLSLALDWYPWGNHAGLYIAREEGYFAAEGLDISIYVPSNPEDVLKLVGSGRDTFGVSYQTDVLLARSEGVPVKSIAALVQHPLNSIMTLKESGLTHPSQLQGKQIGTPGIPSDDAYVAQMLEKDGGDPKTVRMVNVGFDLVPALIGKKVDAIVGGFWVHESILAEEKGFPVNVMKVEEWGVPDFYELVLVASDATIAKNEDSVRRFLRATVKGYAEAKANLRKAIDTLVKVSPETDRSLETKGLPLLAPLWVDGSGRFGTQSAERWESYAAWLKSRGLLKADQKSAEAFTANLLPSA